MPDDKILLATPDKNLGREEESAIHTNGTSNPVARMNAHISRRPCGNSMSSSGGILRISDVNK